MQKALLFSCLFLWFTSTSWAQASTETDDLRTEIELLRQEVYEMKINLSRSHRQFRTGTILYVSGVALTSLGAIAASRNSSGIGNALLIGSGLCAVGLVLHVDSHKFIGRAGISRRGRR